MAIEIPANWPASGWSEIPPLGYLETINEDAPSGTVPTRWQLGSWETTREIAASALPGQVRHKTGLSIGTGKALVKREADDYPWKKGLVYELTGQDAQILLAPEGGTAIPTGQFRVADVSGDISTLGVPVDLDEKQIRGSDKAPGVLGEQVISNQQVDDIYFDPIWLVEQLAQQMGYGVGIRPGGVLSDGQVYNPILDIPFQGSMVPEHPKGVDFTEYIDGEAGFAELDSEGIVGLTPREGNDRAWVEYRLRTQITESTIWTMDMKGRTYFEWNDADGPSEVWFRLWNRSDDAGAPGSDPETTIGIQVGSTGSNGTYNGSVLQDFTFAPSSERTSGVQVQFEVTAGTARVRVRRAVGEAWSAWLTHTITNPLSVEGRYDVMVIPDRVTSPTETYSVVSRLSVVDATDGTSADALLANTQGPEGRIYLEPLGGTSLSPWLDPDLSVWPTMQAVVEAWQGALITDVYGDLRVLNRFTLSGVGTGVEMAVDVGLRFEDIPWIMNYTDQADRLVVKYRPTVERRWAFPPNHVDIVWELEEVTPIYPGVNEIFFTLDYVYPLDLKLIPFIRKDQPDASAGQLHEWDAWRYNNGTGAHIDPNTDIQMRIDRVTSSTWKVYILNRTAEPFHMVDNTGTPWLKIRSTWYFDQTQEMSATRGVATDARNPLEIDLGHYVQSDADANALADFIWARVHQRSWRADTINAVPDYRLDLGDVVELTHERTGVRSNALVTKVKLAGEPGQLTQLLDLVLIPPTWEDFDEVWAAKAGGNTWDDFDALWSAYTWEDFDRTPTATTVAEIEDAM